MPIRYIDNITILADVGDRVYLPSTLIARQTDGSFTTVSVTWEPDWVDTSEEGEFIFEGTVIGYAYKVLCSVQVGKAEDNPESVFPNPEKTVDAFGLPKKDIQTADVPDIDDYQYFKTKIPRNLTEEYQLKQLRELLADKIILARDVNHIRNAVVNIEEFCYSLDDRVEELEQRVEDLERRVSRLERETVIDGENIGRGAEIFDRKTGRILNFRTLRGEGVEVYEDGDEVVIEAKSGCGTISEADEFSTCGDFGSFFTDGDLAFTQNFRFRMVPIHDDVIPDTRSLLMTFGQGGGESKGNKNQGHILKASRRFIMEIKTDDSEYTGLVLDESGGSFYQGESKLKEDVLIDLGAY